MPAGSRVRLLWLSKETADRYGQGGQRRQYFQLREVARSGVDITVLTPAGEQSDESARELATVIRFHGPRAVRGARPDPVRMVLNGGFDRLVIAHAESLDLLREQHGGLDIPWLVDFHNVNSRWYATTGEEELRRMWLGIERAVLAHAAANLTCSAVESQALLAQRPDAVVAEAPNGIDPSEWPDTVLGQRAPGTVAAFGSWWYPPNREGLEWFLAEVWPTVRAEVADARLLLAGSGEPPGIASSTPGVEFRGRVDDIATFLGSVAVVAVPVLKGPGTPVKFAEALASGAAVAATADAAAGNPDAPAVMSNDPAVLAHGIAQLLGDPQLAAARGAAARAYALERCTWSVTQRPLVNWVLGGRL